MPGTGSTDQEPEARHAKLSTIESWAAKYHTLLSANGGEKLMLRVNFDEWPAPRRCPPPLTVN